MDAPFRKFISLISLDGDFDLPQDLFIGLTDGHAQGGEGISGVEIEKVQKILMVEIVLRLQAAARHQGVGDADRGGSPERHFDVEVIILLQKTPVNDAEKVGLIVVPVVLRKLGGDVFQLFRKAVFPGDTVAALQGGGHGLLVFRAVLPQPGAAGVLPLAGVRHIKDIPHLVFPGAGVNESDTLGSPHHIPAHLLIPQVIVGAGGGVRALSVDHQLFRERIFI